jgi:hypothetical protein
VTISATPTRFGWVRFQWRGVDGAARFTRNGAVAELVLACPPAASPVAELCLWFDSGNAGVVQAGADVRAVASAQRQAEVDAAERAEPARRAGWGTGPDAEAGQAAMLALAEPAGRPLPDDFYRDVAATYLVATQAGLGPGAIAEASGVARPTVYGWLKEARRRGLLQPARKAAAA